MFLHTSPTGGRRTQPAVAIIGAGAGGIAMAYHLRKNGLSSFTVFERASNVGGVWRDNTYPGAACDVESHFYSFSFALNSKWSRTFAPQSEILAYLERTVADHGMGSHFRFNTVVSEVAWDDDASVWRLTSSEGQSLGDFDAVVTAVGIFSEPKTPPIPGLDSFPGAAFHSAGWDHAVDFSGQRVGVVGVGASAVQFVPEVAKKARSLLVFQREPGWMVPKLERVYSSWQRRLLQLPGVARTLRWWLAARRERESVFTTRGRAYERRAAIAVEHLRSSIRDRDLLERLTPDYAVGCKRMVRTTQFLRVLDEGQAELVTSPIQGIVGSCVRTADGVSHELDILIFATGFKSAEYLASLRVTGRHGEDLHDRWTRDGTSSYLGMMVPGFPNLYTMYGPNTNAQTSIIQVLEFQSSYIARTLKAAWRRGPRVVEVKAEAAQRFDRRMQSAMQSTVWLSGCGSYFLDRSGRVTTQWPHHALRYWLLTRLPRGSDLTVTEVDTSAGALARPS